MTPQTKAAYDAIKADADLGLEMIAPVSFSHFYGRAATSAAFRAAIKDKIIEVSYTSSLGTPVYKAKQK